MRRLTSLGAVVLATTLAGSCDGGLFGESGGTVTVCPLTNVIDDPPQFQWTYHPVSASNPTPYYSGTIELGLATFTIGGETLTTRAYRQEGGEYTIPGPTLNMAPGNKYVVRFHNTLPYEPASTEHNVFRDPNVSNLHTHGLHISGESPSDDVTRFFEGGRGGDFVYDIPADHMGGTFWYHAHHHGSTFLQVSGGAFGMIVIDDANDGIPANVAAMPERQLMIGYLDPSAAGTGGDTLLGGTLSPTWTVNGQVQGALCAPVDEWQHWRITLADRQATDKTLAVGAACEVQLLARDGVWRTTAPKALPNRSVVITGASRVDLAVRCSNDSTITVNGTTVANVLVNGAGNTTAGPFSNGATGTTWSAVRPNYLRDLRSTPSAQLNSAQVRMGARTINGSKFSMTTPTFTFTADKVQNWSISGNTQHPFHLHVYHFQAQADCSGDYEPGEYYDTMTSSCTARFDLDATTSRVYEGRTIMHCHILEHEDQGAMGWLDVVGGLPPPTFPADTSVTYSEYYTVGGSGPSCGDGSCNGGETKCTCAADCGTPPSTETGLCTGGADDDCDGQVDCADGDCSGDPACAVTCNNNGTCEPGESCTNCSNDCASVTTGPPNNRYCCGDGIQQAAETTAICDGNF